MTKTRSAILAAVTGAAMVATLGLAACGGGAASQDSGTGDSSAAAVETSADTSASVAPAQESSVEKYNLTSAWMGMGDDDLAAYYFEGATKDTGAILVYYTADNTYECWLGAMEASADDKQQITDAESGDTIAFTVTEEGDEDGTISIAADNGLEVSMSPLSIEEVGGLLDEISAYATKADTSATGNTANSTDSIKDDPAEAEQQIEVAMQYLLEEAYGDKINDARIYVEKVYTAEEEQADEALKTYNLSPDEVAFQVRYELHPAEGADVNEFLAGTGEYDEESGWIVDKFNVGILRPTGETDPAYTITDFGTGF